MFCPFNGGRISNENNGLPLAFSICWVTFILLVQVLGSWFRLWACRRKNHLIFNLYFLGAVRLSLLAFVPLHYTKSSNKRSILHANSSSIFIFPIFQRSGLPLICHIRIQPFHRFFS